MSSDQRLTCPLCRCAEFDREIGRMDSDLGFTSHRMQIFICKQCRFVMLFGDGRSIIDFD